MTTIFIDRDENVIEEINEELFLTNGDIYEANGEEYEVQYRKYNNKKKQYYIIVA